MASQSPAVRPPPMEADMTTTKTLRLRWLRFKRHLGSGPTYRRHPDGSTRREQHDDIGSAVHGTRGLASSALRAHTTHPPWSTDLAWPAVRAARNLLLAMRAGTW